MRTTLTRPPPTQRGRATSPRSASPAYQPSPRLGHRFDRVPARAGDAAGPGGGRGGPVHAADLARRIGVIDGALQKEKSPDKRRALQASKLGLQRAHKRVAPDDLDLYSAINTKKAPTPKI